MKVPIFPTFHHLLCMVSEIMDSSVVAILISGRFGQVELNLSHTFKMLAVLTVSLEHRLYQFGKLSSKLLILSLHMNPQLCCYTSVITVASELCATT